jgi:hypothetical protein
MCGYPALAGLPEGWIGSGELWVRHNSRKLKICVLAD